MQTEVIIIGAGAAGLMCAQTAARRGRRVLLLDHARKLAEKIRISGGGNCNFTNLYVGPDNYLSQNPHFCRSALARYTPQYFIELLQQHGIPFHEKQEGQLFCSNGAEAIVDLLRSECEQAGVQRLMECHIHAVQHHPAHPGARFEVQTSRGTFTADALVVATGGLSIPKIGASPLGLKLAEQFGLPIVPPRPGLVPLSCAPEDWAAFAACSGASFRACVSVGGRSFTEQVLLTHRGLSGPAILQASSYWQPGEWLHIDLLPGQDALALLQAERGSKKLLSTWLSQWLPKQFVEVWCATQTHNQALNQYNERQRAELAARLHDWQVRPGGTLGYAKAEVTCGGVDTRALSSRDMQANAVPGLYFIGEVVDVTGQLGGYNFHWAWASGHAAGEAV